MEIGVLGGGISGLTSARRLLQRGHRVTLFEAEAGLGGLATTFRHGDVELERFYHCLLPGDAALLAHVRELGLTSALRWTPTRMGFRYGERTWSLNTPLDLLRFGPLRPWERLRLGLLAVRARLAGTHEALDDVTAADFVRKAVGERAFDVLWRPLLAAKIGDHYPALPALWLTSRLHREKNVSEEQKGCLVGGYRRLIDAFERDLRERGARLHLSSPVRSLVPRGPGLAVQLAGGQEHRFDAVVSALPLPLFQRIGAGLELPDAVGKLSLDYQGVVSAVFLTDRPLTPHYWAPWVDAGTTAQGIIAMSRIVDPERTGGAHVHYLVNYTHRESALYLEDEAELLARYEADLVRVHPEARGHVIARRLFRAPFVEPMWTTGYASRKPPYAVLPGRLYLACTAQLYPRVNSWNACCEMVDEMVAAFAADTARRTAA